NHGPGDNHRRIEQTKTANKSGRFRLRYCGSFCHSLLQRRADFELLVAKLLQGKIGTRAALYLIEAVCRVLWHFSACTGPPWSSHLWFDTKWVRGQPHCYKRYSCA